MAEEANWLWRVGKSIGRTIYACPPGSKYRKGEVVIGMLDTPALATEAVEAHNEVLLRRQAEARAAAADRRRNAAADALD